MASDRALRKKTLTSFKVTERKKALVFSSHRVQLCSGPLGEAWHILTPTPRLASGWLISAPVTGVQWQWFWKTSEKGLSSSSGSGRCPFPRGEDADYFSHRKLAKDGHQGNRQRRSGISGLQRGWLWFMVDYRFVRADDTTASLCGAEPAGGQVVSAGHRIL